MTPGGEGVPDPVHDAQVLYTAVPLRPDSGERLVDTDGERTALVTAAVAAAGWRGVTLPQVTLLGSRWHPVVRFAPQLPRRLAEGSGPQLDYPTLQMWESWTGSFPSYLAEAPLRVLGAVLTRSWRGALSGAQQLCGVGATMVLAADTPTSWQLTKADLAGIWVVRAGSVPAQLLVRGRPGPRTSTRRVVELRHLEEQLLAHALGHGLVSGPPCSG